MWKGDNSGGQRNYSNFLQNKHLKSPSKEIIYQTFMIKCLMADLKCWIVNESNFYNYKIHYNLTVKDDRMVLGYNLFGSGGWY